MALQKRVVEMPLAGGLNQHDDKFQTKGLTTAQNMVMDKAGQMNKRNGYTVMTTDTRVNMASTEIVAEMIQGQALYGTDKPLLLIGRNQYTDPTYGETTNSFGGDNAFAYNSAQDEWVEAGSQKQVAYDVNPVTDSHEDYDLPTMATGNGLDVYAYEKAGQIKVDILDHETRAVISRDWYLNASDPRVVYFVAPTGEKRFMVFGYSGSNIRTISIDAENPTARVSNQTLVSGLLHGDHLYDVAVANDDTVICAYKHVTAGDTYFIDVNINGYTHDADWNQATILTQIFDLGCYTIPGSNPLMFCTGFEASSGDVKAIIYRTDTWAYSSVGTIVDSLDLVGITDMRNFTMAQDDSAIYLGRSLGITGALRYYLTYYRGAESGDHFGLDFEYGMITGYTNTSSYRFGVDKSLNNVALESKAFSYGGKAYVLVSHTQATQKTYYLISHNNAELDPHFTTHAKVMYGRGNGARNPTTDKDGLSQVSIDADSRVRIAILKQDRLLADGEITKSVKELAFVMDPNATKGTNIGKDLVIGGGSVQNFDGKIQELGFNWFPEDLDVAAGTSGSMSDGVYGVCLTYEWTDLRGNIYRSAPSTPVMITLSGGLSNQSIAVFGPTLTLSEHFYKKTNVKVCLYRTEAGGTTYYKTEEVVNDPDENCIGLGATEADSTLINNELLYTGGGILSNIVPPASKLIASKLNRMFIVPMDDQTAIWYSKPKAQGLGWEFPEEFQVRIDQGGDITGLAVMDDKVIVFKRDQMFFFQGEGPNALGSGQFSPTYPIAADVGCVDEDSIVLTSEGLLFKSEKGIYLLSRGLATDYIGAPVEDYNQFKILQTILVDDVSQVRFSLEEGQPTLVYDYLHGIWTTFTNHPAVDACMWDEKYHWLKSNGDVHQADSTFTDENFVIPAIIETPWFKAGSLQNFMRIFRVQLIGKYRSGHTLKVAVFLDYNDSEIVHTFEYDAATNYEAGDPLQFVGHIGRKCQSIKFKVYDDNMTNTYESFELTAVGLEVGMKTGMYKQPKTRKI